METVGKDEIYASEMQRATRKLCRQPTPVKMWKDVNMKFESFWKYEKGVAQNWETKSQQVKTDKTLTSEVSLEFVIFES